jgi:hypothetical protein
LKLFHPGFPPESNPGHSRLVFGGDAIRCRAGAIGGMILLGNYGPFPVVGIAPA